MSGAKAPKTGLNQEITFSYPLMIIILFSFVTILSSIVIVLVLYYEGFQTFPNKNENKNKNKNKKFHKNLTIKI